MTWRWAPQTCYTLWHNKASTIKDLVWFQQRMNEDKSKIYHHKFEVVGELVQWYKCSPYTWKTKFESLIESHGTVRLKSW